MWKQSSQYGDLNVTCVKDDLALRKAYLNYVGG